MILFVFEGKDDKTYFESIKRIFFPQKMDAFICTYNSNIYSLYSKLKEHDVFSVDGYSGNTVSVLNQILSEKRDETLKNIREDEVSEIYLFFDYDFQEDSGTLKENNKRVLEMLSYFSDETGVGKLYINYPMLESLRYTKQLPDKNFRLYKVSLKDCKEIGFKKMTHDFCHYGSNLEYIVPILRGKDDKVEQKVSIARTNWIHLVTMNVSKANYICSGDNEIPNELDPQLVLFKGQLMRYIETEDCCVSVLSAFPLFLFEYFGRKIVTFAP